MTLTDQHWSDAVSLLLCLGSLQQCQAPPIAEEAPAPSDLMDMGGLCHGQGCVDPGTRSHQR